MLVGIDIGGSNIDGVLVDGNKILKIVKNPVDKDNLLATIKTAIFQLTADQDVEKIERINLSTTLSTNAIIENKISEVLVIIQEGPGMVNDFEEKIPYLENFDGYVDHRGKTVVDFDVGKVVEIKNNEAYKDIDSLALVTKFSTRNPEVENKLKDLLADDFSYISLGHKMSGRLNFPRRVYSSYLNSAVAKVFVSFAENIQKALAQEKIFAPLYILKADGATMTLEEGKDRPIESILSGPAASFMGMTALSQSKDDEIYLDIGGTTTDIFFLTDGRPLYQPLGMEIKSMKTLVKGLYSKSIGLGGDSYVRLEGKQIKIGPERKDRPLAFEGNYLTLTDAFNALGLSDLGDVNKSISGLKILGDQMDLAYKKLAEEILNKAAKIIFDEVKSDLEKINSKPLYTVKEVLENKKLQPKKIKLIGGPAKALAPFIESAFGLETQVPKYFQVANALGACLSKPTFEANLQADTKRGYVNIPELGIYKKIPGTFDLKAGEELIKEEILKKARDLKLEDPQVEILEASSFNMVDYYSFGRNIRIKAQIQGGLLYNLWDQGDCND
ncbi:hydantoinase/oxoprolinase family protein [Neofamilia massiliensis]|uniref:hydantoinase/oxoprolinase family protein n=1 Tax=Neofamilia massiliensis TaxID=1673724 RepID=UPI0006BB836F|nr:hydantoinase/oxoprolinase family protein [Neofamilia massiliensis]